MFPRSLATGVGSSIQYYKNRNGSDRVLTALAARGRSADDARALVAFGANLAVESAKRDSVRCVGLCG